MTIYASIFTAIYIEDVEDEHEDEDEDEDEITADDDGDGECFFPFHNTN